jgi:phosphonate transport system substrate-binding protein
MPRVGLAGGARQKESTRSLRAGTFLAPHLFWFYQSVVKHLAHTLDMAIELTQPTDYAALASLDLVFVCGLAYVERGAACALEPLVAPVPRGQRYRDRPIYYSDVIVRRESGLRSFADLRGRSWAYNEKLSHSGYGVTRYHLATLSEVRGYFGRVHEAGWHSRAIHLVAEGEIDAAAIDSHVLASYLCAHRQLARQLRVIASLGPSPIQPIAVNRRLPGAFKELLRQTLLSLADDQSVRPFLARAMIDRFVPVTDATYDSIRYMCDVAEQAGVELA